MTRLRPGAAAALAALALAGCGGDSPESVVEETAAKLGELRSGVLDLEIRADGRGGGDRAQIGFSLEGPFALPERGRLPVARLRYTQRTGTISESATFISDGHRAWISSGAGTKELDRASAERLRARSGPRGIEGLRLDRWLRDAKLRRDGDLDRVRGQLDLPAALEDLARLLGRSDGLGKAAAAQLDRAIRSAPITLWTGSDDRMLRRLEATVRLELDVPRAVRAQLGELIGGRVRFSMRVERPNQPVDVRGP